MMIACVDSLAAVPIIAFISGAKGSSPVPEAR